MEVVVGGEVFRDAVRLIVGVGDARRGPVVVLVRRAQPQLHRLPILRRGKGDVMMHAHKARLSRVKVHFVYESILRVRYAVGSLSSTA